MRYEVAKLVYECCGFEENKWDKDVAKDVARMMNQSHILSNMGYVNWEINATNHVNIGYYDRLKKNIKRCLEGNQSFLENENEVAAYFRIEDQSKIEFRECVFLCFYLIESGLLQGECYDFFMAVMEIAGYQYDPQIFEDMESLILYYVLKKGLKIAVWVDLVQEWYKIKEEYYHNLEIPLVQETEEMTYNNLYHMILDAGLTTDEKTNERRTNYSIGQMNQLMEMKIADENIYKTIQEVVGEELIIHVLNTENRRRFYWLRLIERIIYNQIECIKTCLVNYRENPDNPHNREELKNAVNGFWGEKEKDETKRNGQEFSIGKLLWSEIANNPASINEIELDKIERDLKDSRIIAGKIARCYNELFDGVSDLKTALGKYEMRFSAHYNVSKIVKDPEKWINQEELIPVLDNFSEEGDGARICEGRIRNLLFGKRNNGEMTERPVVTRYMLMMTGLLAKTLLGEKISIDYLEKILENSRFIGEFSDKVLFEKYVLNTLNLLEDFEKDHFNTENNAENLKNRIEILQRESRKIEEEYLKPPVDDEGHWKVDNKGNIVPGIAVFREVISGHKVD